LQYACAHPAGLLEIEISCFSTVTAIRCRNFIPRRVWQGGALGVLRALSGVLNRSHVISSHSESGNWRAAPDIKSRLLDVAASLWGSPVREFRVSFLLARPNRGAGALRRAEASASRLEFPLGRSHWFSLRASFSNGSPGSASFRRLKNSSYSAQGQYGRLDRRIFGSGPLRLFACLGHGCHGVRNPGEALAAYPAACTLPTGALLPPPCG